VKRWGSTMLAALAVTAGLASAGNGAAGSSSGREPGAALFDHRWVSTDVIKNGDPDPLVEGTRIRLKLAHEDTKDVARWNAGCNAFGARVDVKPKRLEIGAISQTEAKCANPIMRQETWVARFFGSDPRWHRSGGKLRLRRGDDVIKLRRRT
jgi:heat shock protein HslJ